MRKSYDFFFRCIFVSYLFALVGLTLPYVQLFQCLTSLSQRKSYIKKMLLKASLKCDVLLYPIVRKLVQVVNIPSEFIALFLIIWELLLSSYLIGIFP